MILLQINFIKYIHHLANICYSFSSCGPSRIEMYALSISHDHSTYPRASNFQRKKRTSPGPHPQFIKKEKKNPTNSKFDKINK